MDGGGECRERRAGGRARHLLLVLRPAGLEALVAVTPTDTARERLLGVAGTGGTAPAHAGWGARPRTLVSV